MPPHRHLSFCVCVRYLLITTVPLLKLHTCYLPSLISMCIEDMHSFLNAHANTLRVVCYTFCGICNMFLLPLETCRPRCGPFAFCSCRGQPHALTGSDVVINLCQTWSGRVLINVLVGGNNLTVIMSWKGSSERGVISGISGKRNREYP